MKLPNSQRCSYFVWPRVLDTDEDGVRVQYPESYNYVSYSIKSDIKKLFPEFKEINDWLTANHCLILSGYGVEIVLSDSDGYGCISIRIKDEDELTDWEKSTSYNWIENNWIEITKRWSNARIVSQTAYGKYKLVSYECPDTTQNISGQSPVQI